MFGRYVHLHTTEQIDLDNDPVAFHVRKSGRSKKYFALDQASGRFCHKVLSHEEFATIECYIYENTCFSHSILGDCISNEIFPPTNFSTSCLVSLITTVSLAARWSSHMITFLSSPRSSNTIPLH